MHAWQMPVHAVLQHLPCAQKPDWHSPGAPQSVPIDFLPQAIEMHVFGLKHCMFAVQEPKHSPFVSQTYGVQEDCVPVWQTPAPLQVGADVSVEVEHVVAPHIVPAACLRHAPAPSQVPSLPQVTAPSSEHWFSGSVPLAALMH